MSEYILYGKKRLCYTEVTDFTDFQGIGRDPLYKRYDSVYAVIEKNIDSQYRDFLAQPVYSEDDQILWYVKEWNTTPCAFNDLSEIEKARYSLIKEKTVSEYERVMKNLSGEDRQILNGAIKYLDEDFMFCYDDKVVVVAWGMTPDSHKHSVKGAVIHDLKIQNNHKVIQSAPFVAKIFDVPAFSRRVLNAAAIVEMYVFRHAQLSFQPQLFFFDPIFRVGRIA